MKKAFISAVMGLVLLGLLVWLANYLSTGTIIITTSNPGSTITLQRTGQGKPFAKVSLTSLSATVGHGQYIATIKNGSQASVQVINFKAAHKTLRYSIGLSKLQTIEPVAYQNAKDVVASNAQLLYLNTSGYLNEIDAQNNIAPLASTQPLQTVKWASPSFGIGQDNRGHLYTVINDFVTPLRVPFTYGGAAVNFDVSSNNQIYVSYGSAVYSGSPGLDFKKIYTATAPNLVLAAGTNKVAIADETEGEGQGSDASKSLLVAVDTSGKVIKTAEGGEVRRLVWSPDGRYVISVSETSSDIYDASLHHIGAVPGNSLVGYATWLNNDAFFYASNNELWSYDVASQRAVLLSSMSLHNTITGLAIGGDKSYVYITTTDSSSGSDYAIRRLGLKGQKAPDYVYRLQDILPITLNDSSLGLINFTSPATILIESFPDSNLSQQAYLQEAQAELQRDGFDLSKLSFKFIQGS